MNTYGHVIKFERMRQNIKQVELAKDICSPAYLSKIESNSIVPSEDVLKMLFLRLKITPPSHVISEEEYFSQVQSIYFEAIMKKDRREIANQLKKVVEDNFVFADSEKYFTYLLILTRLKMLVQANQNDSNLFLTCVSQLSKEFNSYHLFIFYSCLGYFHYYKSDFNLALESFQKAFKIHNIITVQECETADFHFGIASIYLQNQNLLGTLEFINKSLSYFNKEFLFFRAIESNIIKAIAYKRAGQLEQAHENLFIAEKISIDHNSTEILSMIYLNTASIYAEKKESFLAIDYYKKSMEFEDDFNSKLISVYCIVLENSIIENSEEVLKWSKYGLELVEENPIDKVRGLYFHFKCHISNRSGYEDFESIVSDTISHFITVNDYRHAYKYSLLLANYFHKEKKYKKATINFSLANEYLAKKEKRKFVEDI